MKGLRLTKMYIGCHKGFYDMKIVKGKVTFKKRKLSPMVKDDE